MTLPALGWQPLRELTLPAGTHPRGQPHLSAASGLVCAFGRAYVIADDEHHLGIFSDLRSPGRLHSVLAGALPRAAAARKRRKPDFETLMLLPPGVFAAGAVLWALGSGSAPGRDRSVMQALDACGAPEGPARVVDLAPLYRLLRQQLGALNVEGAALVGGRDLWLFSRGGSGARGANAIARYRWRDVRAWLRRAPGNGDEGGRGILRGEGTHVVAPAPVRTWRCELGDVGGVGLGFTDAAALPAALGGGCLFTAVAEDSADSVADGACVASAVGRLDARGRLRWLRLLRGAPKVEGIDGHTVPGGIELCLATDADDPARPSTLLLARL